MSAGPPDPQEVVKAFILGMCIVPAALLLLLALTGLTR